ncbi:MAG: diaminobutyrate--2-oxoglutarate transaminase [Porticoccaceae bacterium]|jgi:diaminobutyrate-2-oxoglutarate transaminase|nr:diaminobutyrate--2-oxoglutarate transaminase [Porticoccaceae bacterium]
MDIFSELESSAQCYADSFPVVFTRGRGSYLYDEDGKAYIDFLAGAGALNYGHNHPVLKQALLDYIADDGVAHGLDMHTEAKARFMAALRDRVLAPRGLEYRLQFTGPTGANAVEAALKLARKIKGRTSVIAFTNGFHGATLGALAATGNRHHRGGSGVPLTHVSRMPYAGYLGRDTDTLRVIDRMLGDPSSGVDLPAAVIVETVQGEGGLNTASHAWLQGLERLCRKHDMLLIVDDIQAGCGRTGTFFSFEPAGIKPDMVTLSKSLSGYGLPMSLLLYRPELDVWKPGEHNGTFRGNNHAFVTAAAALEHFWSDDALARSVRARGEQLREGLQRLSEKFGVARVRVKGRGLMQGIECADGETAERISRAAFARGLIIETSGNRGQVLKCLCPLTITEEELREGLAMLAASLEQELGGRAAKAS